MNTKIAIVIPWFGKDLHGGAEQHAWQIAHRLQSNGISITVLTTCCKSFHDDWTTNHYEPGEYIEDNVKILRFPVDKRNKGAFDRAVAKLLSMPQSSLIPGAEIIPWTHENIYLKENINSSQLLAYIKQNIDSFDVFIFLPYLFTPIIQGVSLTKNKAILLPCLHNEPYAYLESVKKIFHECGRLMFNSHGEQILACELYGDWILDKSAVTGAGVEIDKNKLTNALETAEYGDYLLYLGRKCAEKNVLLMIDAFEEFVRKTGSHIRLLLAGPSDMPIRSDTQQVYDFGEVSEDTKYKLLRNCRALVNPSENESFSRVIFEAWFAEKPVLVNRKCLATYTALSDSGFAGWSADTKDSFVHAFQEIASVSKQTLQTLGKKGAEFATSMADWDKVISRFINEVNIAKSNHVRITLTNEKSQFLIIAHTIGESSASARDALGQIMMLSTKGLKVHAYCKHVTTTIPFSTINLDTPDSLMSASTTTSIIHWSPQWQKLTDIAKKLPGQKIVRYMEWSNPETLSNFLRLIQPEVVLCHSEYLLRKLLTIWNGTAIALPPCYGMEMFPHHSILVPLFKKFDDECVNILVTGSLSAPYSTLLCEAISRYHSRYRENIRLFIVQQDVRTEKNYLQSLPSQVQTHVIYLQNSTSDELYTYYKVTDVIVCLPEDEDRWQDSILLAQYWGTPAITFQNELAGEIAGDNQIILPLSEPALLTSALRILSMDSDERSSIIHTGYKNTLNYSLGRIVNHFTKVLQSYGISI